MNEEIYIKLNKNKLTLVIEKEYLNLFIDSKKIMNLFQYKKVKKIKNFLKEKEVKMKHLYEIAQKIKENSFEKEKPKIEFVNDKITGMKFIEIEYLKEDKEMTIKEKKVIYENKNINKTYISTNKRIYYKNITISNETNSVIKKEEIIKEIEKDKNKRLYYLLNY